jgi:MFS family permease
MFGRVMHLVGGYPLKQRDLRVLYLVVFLSFVSGGLTFPLRLLYAQKHGATAFELGLMAAAFIAAPLISQFPAGALADRVGRVPVLIAAMAAHAVISLLYIVLVTPVEQIGLRVLEGMSVSGIQPAVNAYIADVTPEEHRSEAFSVWNAASNAGFLVGPLIGGVVAQRYSFAVAFGVNVAVEVVAVIIAWIWLREPVVHQHAAHLQRVSLRSLMSFPLICAYVAAINLQAVIGVFSAVWTIWLHDIGASFTYIGLTLTVFALPQIFFSAVAGRAVGRWGRAPVLMVGSVIIGIIYAWYGFTENLALVLVLGTVEGVIFMFIAPAAQSLLADASPLQARGRAQGVAGVIGAAGGAVTAFVSLPAYHAARPLPFVGLSVVMVVCSFVAAAGVIALERGGHLTGKPGPSRAEPESV